MKAKSEKQILVEISWGGRGKPTPEWKLLYGHRSLAEAVNSWMKNKLSRGERARSLNQTHQWIDLMIMLVLRND